MRLGKFALFAPAVLLVLLLFAGTAFAETVTFGLRAADTYKGNWQDTHVRATKPNDNYSSANASILKNGEYNLHYTIDVSALPDDAEITSAKLHFFADPYITNGSFYIEARSLNKPLVVTADTWNKYDGTNAWTSPGGGENDSSAAYGSSWQQSGSYGAKEIEFNSAGKSYIQGKVGGGNVQLMLFASAQGQQCDANGVCMRYIRNSEEPADSKKPYLEITYTTGGGGGGDEEQYCGDGTAYGSCSLTTKPKFCSNGSLVDNCTQCGCNAGFTCDTNGSCKVQQQECSAGETRQCGTTDTGACEYGTQTCANGTWGLCIGAVEPGTEVCGNGTDEDCDGADSVCGAGENYYVCGSAAECNAEGGSGWGTGNNNYACTSKAQPCVTIAGGLKKMASGDTLIIGDGTYSGTENAITYPNIKSGTPGAYTAYMAENPFHVTLDGGVTLASDGDYLPMLDIGYNGNAPGKSYVHVDGIFFWRTTLNISDANHVKITRCAFAEASNNLGSTVGGWVYNVGIGGGSTYILIEDSITFGEGRYKIGISSTGRGSENRQGANNHIIIRRVIGRFDFFWENMGMISTFGNYWQTDNAFQNCISLDGQPFFVIIKGEATGSNTSFMCPNCAPISRLDIEGSMALNDPIHGMFFESTPGRMHVKDSVIWGITPVKGGTSGSLLYVGTDHGNNLFENMTIGGSTVDRGAYYKDGNVSSDINNSIFYGLPNVTSSYPANKNFDAFNCSFYNNAYNGKTGVNPIKNPDGSFVDPIGSGSLKYLPMIEPGSPLYTAGTDGGPVGATILKKIGVSGTLMDEEGWDTVTNDTLWPWPYEDEIKRLMCDEKYNLHIGALDRSQNPVVFDEGFCKSGSLTQYIWEYLGNPMPDWIYGNGTPPVPPVQNCGEGLILSACKCGGTEYDSGYCCSGAWQASACQQGCEQQGKIECNGICITPTCTSDAQCQQWKECKQPGTCNSHCGMSIPGLMNYVTQWRNGTLSITQVMQFVAAWKGS